MLKAGCCSAAFATRQVARPIISPMATARSRAERRRFVRCLRFARGAGLDLDRRQKGWVVAVRWRDDQSKTTSTLNWRSSGINGLISPPRSRSSTQGSEIICNIWSNLRFGACVGGANHTKFPQVRLFSHESVFSSLRASFVKRQAFKPFNRCAPFIKPFKQFKYLPPCWC
jgi:hypothetical protein